MTTAPSPGTAAQDLPLWTPSPGRIKDSALARFAAAQGLEGRPYEDIWRWSVENPEKFWSAVWDACGVIGEKGDTIIENPAAMPGARFFPQARLNYAQNLLRRRDNSLAIVFRPESGAERSLTFAALHAEVSRWAAAFRTAGVEAGDRIAACLPNMPEAVIAMLAAASIGAVWSSASPDFGIQGLLDRFGQIAPKILIAVDSYRYNGKAIDCREKIAAVAAQLHPQKTVIVPYDPAAPAALPNELESMQHFLAPYVPDTIAFAALPFDHPLFIMFSSGTTGIPKCIVHGAGGTLIQHLKEHRLHCDIRPGDRVFYFTTCGWMMWNWLAGALASEAALLLFDGSPFHPDGLALWEYASKHACTFFGTSARYIDALRTSNLRPCDSENLLTLRALASTGSPLSHEGFDYVYASVKSDLHLASISGGTDIVSCFVLGNPLSPVFRGEIQGPGLGMAVDVFSDDGAPLPPGAGSGELVCTRPFPSMPVGFWNDEDGSRYRAAYFERFPGIWCHGDWIERTAHGGFIIHGRSDATLNPGGVRIGTAEIYRQVEQFPDIVECIAVGQDWQNDVRVLLFVRLKDGAALNDDLKDRIKKAIRTGASPRHVPAKILAVADIPRTRSNKITELAVRDVIHGRRVKNVEALANPESLALYKNLPDLQN